MTRPPVTLFALFVLPFVAYAAYVWVRRRHPFVRGHWRLRTLMSLAIGGLLLMLGNLIYLAQFSGAAPGAAHVPAHVEDGRVVPGRAR
jgi:hypothetical protein